MGERRPDGRSGNPRPLSCRCNTPLTREQVRDRAVEALADEAQRMLDEGVVGAPEDVDLCMLLGAGWPFALGGLTPYLDRSGAAVRVTGSRFLPPGTRSRSPLPSPRRGRACRSGLAWATASTIPRVMSWAVRPTSASTSARLPCRQELLRDPDGTNRHDHVSVLQ
jgi:hypothetical protein